MHTLLKLSLTALITAFAVAPPVRAVEQQCTNYKPQATQDVIVEEYPNGQPVYAGGPPLHLGFKALEVTDQDIDDLTLKLRPMGDDLKALVTLDKEKNEIVFTPPPVLPANDPQTYEIPYKVTDPHGGLARAAVSVTVIKDVPLGQAWNGTLYTLNQELSYQVGNLGVALFIPDKETYTMAIFSNPGGGKQTYWGCGPQQSPVVSFRSNCDWDKSLQGDVTYLYRIPVYRGNDGVPKLPGQVQMSTAQMLEELGAYYVALSQDPSTPINQKNNPEPEGCYTSKPKGGVTFYSSSCDLLNPNSNLWSHEKTQGVEMLYLKIQADPENAESAKCGSKIKCRVDVTVL